MFGFTDQEPDEELTHRLAVQIQQGIPPSIAARRECVWEDDVSLWLLRGQEDLQKGQTNTACAAFHRVLTLADAAYRRSLLGRVRWLDGPPARAAEKVLRVRYGWGTRDWEFALSQGIIGQLRGDSVDRAQKQRYLEAARDVEKGRIDLARLCQQFLSDTAEGAKAERGAASDE